LWASATLGVRSLKVIDIAGDIGRLSVTTDAEISGLTVWSTSYAKGLEMTFRLFTLILGLRACLWASGMLGVRSSKVIDIAGDMGRLSVTTDVEISGLTEWSTSLAKCREITFRLFTLTLGLRAHLWASKTLGVRSSKAIDIAGDTGRLSVTTDAELSALSAWSTSWAEGIEITFRLFTSIPGAISYFFL